MNYIASELKTSSATISKVLGGRSGSNRGPTEQILNETHKRFIAFAIAVLAGHAEPEGEREALKKIIDDRTRAAQAKLAQMVLENI